MAHFDKKYLLLKPYLSVRKKNLGVGIFVNNVLLKGMIGREGN